MTGTSSVCICVLGHYLPIFYFVGLLKIPANKLPVGESATKTLYFFLVKKALTLY